MGAAAVPLPHDSDMEERVLRRGGQFDDSASSHILVDPAEHQIGRTLR